MVGDLPVVFFVDIVCYNKKKIESRKQRIWEGDVLVRVFVDVILGEEKSMRPSRR